MITTRSGQRVAAIEGIGAELVGQAQTGTDIAAVIGGEGCTELERPADVVIRREPQAILVLFGFLFPAEGREREPQVLETRQLPRDAGVPAGQGPLIECGVLLGPVAESDVPVSEQGKITMRGLEPDAHAFMADRKLAVVESIDAEHPLAVRHQIAVSDADIGGRVRQVRLNGGLQEDRVVQRLGLEQRINGAGLDAGAVARVPFSCHFEVAQEADAIVLAVAGGIIHEARDLLVRGSGNDARGILCNLAPAGCLALHGEAHCRLLAEPPKPVERAGNERARGPIAQQARRPRAIGHCADCKGGECGADRPSIDLAAGGDVLCTDGPRGLILRKQHARRGRRRPGAGGDDNGIIGIVRCHRALEGSRRRLLRTAPRGCSRE